MQENKYSKSSTNNNSSSMVVKKAYYDHGYAYQISLFYKTEFTITQEQSPFDNKTNLEVDFVGSLQKRYWIAEKSHDRLFEPQMIVF